MDYRPNDVLMQIIDRWQLGLRNGFHQPSSERWNELGNDHEVDVFLQRGGGERFVHRAEDFENCVDSLLAVRAQRADFGERAVGIFFQARVPNHGGQRLK
jgi:hypothetical protein